MRQLAHLCLATRIGRQMHQGINKIDTYSQLEILPSAMVQAVGSSRIRARRAPHGSPPRSCRGKSRRHTSRWRSFAIDEATNSHGTCPAWWMTRKLFCRPIVSAMVDFRPAEIEWFDNSKSLLRICFLKAASCATCQRGTTRGPHNDVTATIVRALLKPERR